MRIVNHKVRERRKKRMFVPSLYLLLEVIFIWLVLSVIQQNLFISTWELWSILLFIVFVGYAILKTVHVYQRQKDYPTE
jgi:C4-dicarboxylate transporter